MEFSFFIVSLKSIFRDKFQILMNLVQFLKWNFLFFLSLFGQISKFDESVMIKKMDLISALQNENKNVIVICFITFHIYI